MNMRKIIIISLAIFWAVVLAILGNGLKTDNSRKIVSNSNSPLSVQENSSSTVKVLLPTVKTLSSREVSKHNKIDDCWMVVNDKVYDITKYLPYHPGGINIILRYCGKDGTNAFLNLPHSQNAANLLASYFIGDLNTARN